MYNKERCRKIKAIFPDGREVTYPTIKDCIRETHVAHEYISRSIRRDEPYKGFRFFDVNEEEE